MPRWRVIVSRIGNVDPIDVPAWALTGHVEEAVFETGSAQADAREAFRAAAKMARKAREPFSPHVTILFDELVVLRGYVHARVEWPFPACFWRWLDKFSANTRGRLDPICTPGTIEHVSLWAENGKKIRLVLDKERRESIRYLLLTLLGAAPDLGLHRADEDSLYGYAALVAWSAAQPDLILTSSRRHALDTCLSVLDALVQP